MFNVILSVVKDLSGRRSDTSKRNVILSVAKDLAVPQCELGKYAEMLHFVQHGSGNTAKGTTACWLPPAQPRQCNALDEPALADDIY